MVQKLVVLIFGFLLGFQQLNFCPKAGNLDFPEYIQQVQYQNLLSKLRISTSVELPVLRQVANNK